MPDLSLKDKVAIVTGGSGDIGGAIARKLAEQGAITIATYVGNEKGAMELVQSIQDKGGIARAVQMDQRSPESVNLLIENVRKTEGNLDILINNAAWNIGIPFPQLDALTPEIWDRVLETNVRGPFLLARAGEEMLKAGLGGHIVNISSAGGISPGSSSIAYSSSKAALNHLTRCLAVAMAPKVSVNCIAPGLVENTRMAQRLPEKVAEGARRQAVLGLVGQPEDIAEQTFSFVSSRSVTGQTIVIDGGMPGAMR